MMFYFKVYFLMGDKYEKIQMIERIKEKGDYEDYIKVCIIVITRLKIRKTAS